MSSGNPEEPAKNYQVAELQRDISSVLRAVEKVNDKIDTKLITREQLDAEIKLVRKDYDPMRKNLSRITWTVIGVIVPLVVMSALQFIANVSVGNGG